MSFDFDPFGPEARENPYPAYRRMLDDETLRFYRNDERGFVSITRYDDAVEVLRDWSTFTSARGVDIDESSYYFGEGVFLQEDPPVHKLLRGVVHGDFSPKAIRGLLEGPITRAVEALLDRLSDADEPDFGNELTWRLPTRSIALFLGLPQDDVERLIDLELRYQRRIIGQVEVPEDAIRASEELHDYFSDLIQERRRKTSGDLLSRIAAASVGGQPIGDAAIGMSLILFAAAIDTTACLLGNALCLLETHPEQRRWLSDNPDQIPAAVEEVLRFDPPLQVTKRVAVADALLAGVEIPADTDVYIFYGAANRDQRRFDNPDAFDIRRSGMRNLAFADGIHHCIGAPLARLEANIALRLVLKRMPDYSLLPGSTRFESHMMRGPQSLPVDRASIPRPPRQAQPTN
jgi:cytochrome P450 family 130